MNKTVLGVILFIVAFTLLFTACVTVDKVASAEQFDLPSTGIVGNNLLLNSSDFTSLEYWNNLGDLGILTLSNGIITFSGDGCELSQESVLDTTFAEYSDLVCSFYVTSVTGTVFFSCTGAEHITSVIRVEQGLNVYRFSLLGSGSVVPLFSNYTVGAQFSLKWIKLEYGTDFTGFVPNDYEHYGFDEGYSQGTDYEKDYLYNYNDGWTNYLIFRDYYHSNSYIDDITSTSGTIEFSSGNGISLASGFSYSIKPTVSWLSTNNSLQTFSFGYGGNFTEGDIIVTINYSYYTSFEPLYPFNGIDYEVRTSTFNLIPNKVSLFTASFRKVDSVSITIGNSVSSFYLRAYKLESGSVFTGFPVSDVASDSYLAGVSSGFDSGYQEGLLRGEFLGHDEGYAEGLSYGDSQGYDRGRAEGYTAGLETASTGTWYNMFTGLIDVPVKAISGFFDIDILGFNVLNLFRTVVVLSIFAYVIKFLVGKVG